MKLLFERLKIMKIKKISNYEDKIKQLIDFLVVNKKGKKACVELINVLSFNKRHIAQSTWLDIIQGITPVKSEIINNDKNITDKTSKNKLLLRHDFDSDSDDEEIIYPKIEYKGQTYLLDGCELFTISSNGKKLNLFGTFINGRVKKHKEIDL
jgi:hypothetical protein